MNKAVYYPRLDDKGSLNSKFEEFAIKNTLAVVKTPNWQECQLEAIDSDGYITVRSKNALVYWLPSVDMVDWHISNDAKMELIHEMSEQMNTSDMFFEDLEEGGYDAYGESTCNCRVVMGKWLVELTLQDEDHVDHSFTFTDRDLYTAMKQAYAKFQEYVEIHED